MASPATETAAVGAAIAGGILAGTFFGIPIETLKEGFEGCFLGVLGRCSFDLYRTLEAKDPVAWKQIAKWSVAGFAGSPMAAVAVALALKMTTGAVADDYFGVGVILLGFGGSNIIGAAWTLVTKLLSLKFGFSVPSNLPDMGDKDAKK